MKSEYRPYTLIAELTYRCPLRCPYCSNPLDYAGRHNEIDADTWLRVFEEAEALGVVQLNLTGGEPLIRDDLERLVEGAQQARFVYEPHHERYSPDIRAARSLARSWTQ